MISKKPSMSKRLGSLIATVIVVGYIGSYTPSLLGWWEQTWHPHGRDSSVIQPGDDTNRFVQLPSNAQMPSDAWGNGTLEDADLLEDGDLLNEGALGRKQLVEETAAQAPMPNDSGEGV